MSLIDLPSHLRSSVCVITDTELPEVEGLLSAEELSEAERILNEKRRREWMLGRIAAKRLAVALGLCKEPQHCSVPSRGVRPTLFLNGEPSEMHLSLSHSGEIAAATISRQKVGIDIQKRRRIDERSRKFFLRDDETDLTNDQDESTLLDLWSAKEAALKASGVNRYREVLLLDRAIHPDRTDWRFEAGSVSGRIETIWLAGNEVILALAMETT